MPKKRKKRKNISNDLLNSLFTGSLNTSPMDQLNEKKNTFIAKNRYTISNNITTSANKFNENSNDYLEKSGYGDNRHNSNFNNRNSDSNNYGRHDGRRDDRHNDRRNDHHDDRRNDSHDGRRNDHHDDRHNGRRNDRHDDRRNDITEDFNDYDWRRKSRNLDSASNNYENNTSDVVDWTRGNLNNGDNKNTPNHSEFHNESSDHNWKREIDINTNNCEKNTTSNKNNLNNFGDGGSDRYQKTDRYNDKNNFDKFRDGEGDRYDDKKYNWDRR